MNLKELHDRLAKLIVAEEELAQAKLSLKSAQVEIKDLQRRLEAAESDLAQERSGGKSLLTPANERWLMRNNARLEFSSPPNGKLKAKLRTGRRADGRATELVFDPPENSKPLRIVRNLIEEHKAR